MNKKTLAWFAVIIILFVAAAAGAWALMGQRTGKYSAVLLSTGELYFGKLSLFPSPHIKDPYVLQRAVDANNASQLIMVPFSSAIWGPSNVLNINPKDIIYWTPLSEKSEAAEKMNDPQKAVMQQQQQAPQQVTPKEAPESDEKTKN